MRTSVTKISFPVRAAYPQMRGKKPLFATAVKSLENLTLQLDRNEVDDINFGLQHFYGEYDVVHCRLIDSGVRVYFRTSLPV